MARGTAHDAEMKAAAIASVSTGESISAVARRYGLSRSTVQRWTSASAVGEVRTAAIQQKKESLGEEIFDLIRASVRMLKAQVNEASKPEWIVKQNAGDLAVFHGVVADKTVRLLSSMRQGENDDNL